MENYFLAWIAGYDLNQEEEPDLELIRFDFVDARKATLLSKGGFLDCREEVALADLWSHCRG